MRYFDIYIDYGDKYGYSIFIEAADENDAIGQATTEGLFRDNEDVDHIKGVTEITKEQYEAAH